MKILISSLLPLVMMITSCAEKKISAEKENHKIVVSSKDMTKPQPTEPALPVFEKEGLKQAVRFRKIQDLKVSASGVFGSKALRDIGRPLKRQKTTLFIFDLRQEPHGYINDEPLAWIAPNNFGSVDLTAEESIRRERRLLGDLHIGEKINKVTIKSLETEESMVRTSGFQYVRFAVTEHLRPVDFEVDRFVERIRTLPENSWVHLHDRTGEGRSSLFLAMFEFLVAGRYQSFEDILQKQRDLGSIDLMDLGLTTDWNYSYKKERADFLREFYRYAKENPRGATDIKIKTWAEWSQ